MSRPSKTNSVRPVYTSVDSLKVGVLERNMLFCTLRLITYMYLRCLLIAVPPHESGSIPYVVKLMATTTFSGKKNPQCVSLRQLMGEKKTFGQTTV